LIDDVDSTLGVQILGQNPIEGLDMGFYKLSNRFDRDKLDYLLRRIHDPYDNPIGHLWAKSVNGDHKPKDYNLVCILVSGYGLSHNASSHFFVNCLDTVTIVPVDGTNAFKLDNTLGINKMSTIFTDQTFVHELSHSFTLGDEYIDSASQIPEVLHYISDDSIITVNAKDYINDNYSNLTVKADTMRMLETDLDNRTHVLHGDEIKWNWHRIRKAGVVNGTIEYIGDDKFRIPLERWHGNRFVIGDRVHLRLRQYREFPPKPLIKNPTISLPLEVTYPLPEANVIHVSVKYDAIFDYPNMVNDPTMFLAGSIVYVPTPAPDSAKTDKYPYAEMIAKNIKDYISQQKLPLSDSRDDPQVPDIPDSLLHNSFSKKDWPKIVGLYSGGWLYHYGIFHPTGDCSMREQMGNRGYCAVCKYILVDSIDPTKHWHIDREYEKVYPQK
jgi:hypothetical protein